MTLGERLYEVVRDRRAGFDALNAAFRDLESVFVRRLGPETVGRVRLRGHNDETIEHLVFRGGRFFLEDGEPGNRTRVSLLTAATIERRLLAIARIEDLWRACGGPPL